MASPEAPGATISNQSMLNTVSEGGANAGFAAAFMNPFTVGVAQGIVGLPLFSGIGFRVVLWVVMTTVTILFLSRYAARVKANPRISLMRDCDLKRETIAAVIIAQALHLGPF